jgi:FMN phosphatase YigB (HAD superfamily)
MVGDTLGADILGARNSGIFSIWIRRRANTPGNRAHVDNILPDAQIDTLSELPGLFAQLAIG